MPDHGIYFSALCLQATSTDQPELSTYGTALPCARGVERRDTTGGPENQRSWRLPCQHHCLWVRLPRLFIAKKSLD